MEKKSIEILSTARYFIQGGETEHVGWHWLVAHGYGQLAAYFIRHFTALPTSHKVIAPEGLHRFYISDNTGRVGASWMTKLDRENDIKGYVDFIEQIMQAECTVKNPNIIAFGFSQGAATISRWLCNTEFEVKILVLWAGAWPSDMNIDHNIEMLLGMKIIIVVGLNDQYLGDQGVEKYLRIFDDNNIPYQLLRFDGDHRLDQETLKKVVKGLPQ